MRMRRRTLHGLECLHFLRPTWPGGRLEEKTKRGRKENQGGKLLSRVAKDIVPARLLARAFVCVCVCESVCVCVSVCVQSVEKKTCTQFLRKENKWQILGNMLSNHIYQSSRCLKLKTKTKAGRSTN